MRWAEAVVKPLARRTEITYKSRLCWVSPLKVKEETDENNIEFHNIAHGVFGTDMGFVS